MTLLQAAAVTLVPAGPVVLDVAAPASKSLTNRALLVAALAAGTSTVGGALDSDDSLAMQGAVEALGAVVEPVGGDLQIEGIAGRVTAPDMPIDARLSGTTMRFVTATAALSTSPVTITGGAPLLRRPIGPLAAALRALGATVHDDRGHPPVTVFGGLNGGAVTVDATGSSQFVSAVLLAAPYASEPVQVTASGSSAHAYIAMTVDLMQRWGAGVEQASGSCWHVSPGGYRARREQIEYDASAAAHLLALAVATGGDVTVSNAAPSTRQPDAQITDVFAAMGATVRHESHGLRVTGPDTLRPFTVDLSAMPDQVTTVAALAALASGTSTITGAAVTRGHETDRLAALANELRKLGVSVEEHPDGLTIAGGAARGPARLETYDDHRLAMAFSAIAARIERVTIAAPGCVAKTYPQWWTVLEGAGVGLQASA